MLSLLFYKGFLFDGDFVAKGKNSTCFLSPFLFHHIFVILSGLKAFRLQKPGIRVRVCTYISIYCTSTPTEVVHSVWLQEIRLIMSPNLSLIPPVSKTPEKANDRRCSSVRLRFQFHNSDAVLHTRAPTRADSGEMCVHLEVY